MCKETATTKEDAPVEEAASDVPTASMMQQNDNDNDTTAVVSRDWCCRERKDLPKTGTDLGVWEESLEDQSSIYSKLMLSYLTPLLQVGSSKVLDEQDIGVPSKCDLAGEAYASSRVCWEEQTAKTEATNAKLKEAYKAKLAACSTDAKRDKVKAPIYKEPSIYSALFKAFGAWKVYIAIALYMISSLMVFIPVLILNDLVKFFESGDSVNDYDGFVHPWVEVALLGVIPFLISLLQTRSSAIMAHCAVFVRTAVSTMLYRKALRVSGAGRAMTSTGQVVNMMSNDTAQLQRFLQFIGLTITAPITIVVALVLIYQQVGNATWVGAGYMVLLAPVNAFVFSIVSKQRRKVLKYSDMRVKMMNEILSGIRIIKFYAWERAFGKEVGTLRGKELDALTKLAYTSAVGFSLILMSAPIIQPILVFVTYVAIQDEPLAASTAFTTVALFNVMRFPFAFLPMGLLQYIQSKISLRRLERYLDLPELTEYVKPEAPPGAAVDSPSAQHGSVTIQNGTFTWVDPNAAPIRPIQDEAPSKKKQRKSKGDLSEEKAKAELKANMHSDMKASMHSLASSVDTEGTSKGPAITLQAISCTLEAGSLVAVVGAVGSGKSSFLSAILGEMEPLEDSKVYVPRPDGVKSGYISYCTQTPWVVNATLRDNLLFGREFNQERYDQVVEACALSDDLVVLPAGDLTEIGERGINLSGGQKARVSLARAMYSTDTQIMLYDDPLSAVDAHVGEHIFANAITGPLAAGTTRVLVTHHVHLLSRCSSVIVLENGRIKHQGTYNDLVSKGVDFAGAVDVSKAKPADTTATKTIEPEAEGGHEEKKEQALSDKKKAELKKSGKKLVKDEEREEGSVDGSAYMHYGRAGGLLVAVMVMVVQGLGRGAEVTAVFWLALWADRAFEASANGEEWTQGKTYFYVGIYAMFGLLGVLGLTFRAILVAVHRLGASKKLHDDLTDSILRAPVEFFDVTPVGRILNRFAADMDKIDLELTQSLSQGVSTVSSVVGAIAAMVVATSGTFLVPLVPIGFIYYKIQKWFRKTSTELQRINSIANSPIFADFSQTLSGTSTIRAYGEETRFFNQCKSSFDNMNASYILVQLTNYWLGLRLDILGGLMGAFIGGIAVATSESGFIPAGYLGLALAYSIEVTNFLKHGVRMIATIEAQMNSVERVLYYSNNIAEEAPEFVPENDPKPGTWPLDGEIVLQNASMRYRDGPLVLKDISLRVKAGEKVGVCGRTGSGKSSLMVLLFRISEIEADGGKVLIDGVDAASIGTSPLRSNLSIIPQDPVIFSNTVRYNLDPFSAATEEELWDVLKKVQMAEVIALLPAGLDEQVAEGGENFSQGQRQLLCIARSLLRRPKVLVMDEATASIDNTTDAAIQGMIRENFSDATILTIAHRLNTIMDSDRVLVLDDGRIAEYDSPDVLLSKPDGIFRAMIDKSRAASSMTIDEE